MRYLIVLLLMLVAISAHSQDEYRTKNKRAIAKFEGAKRYYVIRDYPKASYELRSAVEIDNPLTLWAPQSALMDRHGTPHTFSV